MGIRPVWHQRADRVQAHILVCSLAYVLWKTLEQWQRLPAAPADAQIGRMAMSVSLRERGFLDR